MPPAILSTNQAASDELKHRWKSHCVITTVCTTPLPEIVSFHLKNEDKTQVASPHDCEGKLGKARAASGSRGKHLLKPQATYLSHLHTRITKEQTDPDLLFIIAIVSYKKLYISQK